MDKNAIFNDVRMAAMKAYAITQKTLPYKTGLLSNKYPGKEGGFRIEEISPGTYKVYIDLATVPYAVLEKMTKHPLTDQGIEKFVKDYKAVFGE